MGDTDILLLLVMLCALVGAVSDSETKPRTMLGEKREAPPKRVLSPVVTDALKLARGKPLRRPEGPRFSPAPSQRTRRWWLR